LGGNSHNGMKRQGGERKRGGGGSGVPVALWRRGYVVRKKIKGVGKKEGEARTGGHHMEGHM